MDVRCEGQGTGCVQPSHLQHQCRASEYDTQLSDVQTPCVPSFTVPSLGRPRLQSLCIHNRSQFGTRASIAAVAALPVPRLHLLVSSYLRRGPALWESQPIEELEQLMSQYCDDAGGDSDDDVDPGPAPPAGTLTLEVQGARWDALHGFMTHADPLHLRYILDDVYSGMGDACAWTPWPCPGSQSRCDSTANGSWTRGCGGLASWSGVGVSICHG